MRGLCFLRALHALSVPSVVGLMGFSTVSALSALAKGAVNAAAFRLIPVKSPHHSLDNSDSSSC